MLFEMMTGGFLFEPRKGPNYGKDDDHLAQIQELLKRFPRKFSTVGKYWRKYMNGQGVLRRIPQL